jgi:hypothetical protein
MLVDVVLANFLAEHMLWGYTGTQARRTVSFRLYFFNFL